MSRQNEHYINTNAIKFYKVTLFPYMKGLVSKEALFLARNSNSGQAFEVKRIYLTFFYKRSK